MVNRQRHGRYVAAIAVISVLTSLLLSACGGGDGGGGGGGGDSPRLICEDLNDVQRAATKLGEDLSAATSNSQAESLGNEANSVNQGLSSALASGAFAGSLVND